MRKLSREKIAICTLTVVNETSESRCNYTWKIRTLKLPQVNFQDSITLVKVECGIGFFVSF